MLWPIKQNDKMMENQEVIIKVIENGVYFNSDKLIGLNDIDFHHFKQTKYLEKLNCEQIIWLQIKINSIENDIVKAEIINFLPKNTNTFYQNAITKDFSKIWFWSKNTYGLLILTKYSKSINPIKITKSVTENNQSQLKQTYFENKNIFVKEPKKLILTDKFKLHFTDIKICFGCATFEKFVKELNSKIEFSIKNDYFEPNFDLIKFHFPKLLKPPSKTINIEIYIETIDGKIINKIAKSKEIEQIDNNFIDIIHYQRIMQLVKNPLIESPDKSLYTPDEIFKEFETSELGNVFKDNDKEILKILLEKLNVRNQKQLNYLSGKLQSDKDIIRFSLKSKKNSFGFLFYIDKGLTKHHFVWELINSHATYIWSIDKNNQNLNSLFSRIQNTINMIKTIGRDEYKQEYKNRQIDQDIDFDIIRHEHAKSDLIDHFPEWRKRLDEKIV